MSNPKFIEELVKESTAKWALAVQHNANLNKLCLALQKTPVSPTPKIFNHGLPEIQNPSLLHVYPSRADSKDYAEKAEQVLTSIHSIDYGVFEIRGNKEGISAGYYASESHLAIIDSALKTFYPNCITEKTAPKESDLLPEKYDVIDLVTDEQFYKPFTNYQNFTISPLNQIVRLLFNIEKSEGCYQVVFASIPGEVGDIIKEAIDTEWLASQGTVDNRVTPSLQSASEKIEYKSPDFKVFYAVSARIILPSASHLDSSVKAFISNYTYGGKALKVLDNSHYTQEQIKQMLIKRSVYHSGFLLNSQELCGLAHLPYQILGDKQFNDVFAAAPVGDLPIKSAEYKDVSIGTWACGNSYKKIHLPIQKEIPHCHVLGLSRMGKSQLLTHIVLEKFLK